VITVPGFKSVSISSYQLVLRPSSISGTYTRSHCHSGGIVQYGGEDGIDRQEFGSMLANIDGLDLSELNAKTLARMEQFVDTEFEHADLNHDGCIDSDE
jgi:hypothetical protein